MKINDSQQTKSLKNRLLHKEQQQSFDSILSSPASNQPNSQVTAQRFSSQRQIQIVLSIIIVVLSTLWVQITMQRHAPFIRASQNYFNQIILQHYSQDIYEGKDVIYWKTGEYYRYEDILAVFTRLNDTLYDLNTNSLFVLPQQYNQIEFQVEILAKYDIPQQDRISSIVQYSSTLQELSGLLESTFMNRSFYQNLWQAHLQVAIPIKYRDMNCILDLKMSTELFSSLMMSFKINVDIQDSDQNLIKGKYDENNLGIRKKYNPHDMEITIPYLFWVILIFYIVLFGLEFKFILKRNQAVSDNLRIKIRQQKRIEKLLQDINKNQQNLQTLKVNKSSSNESKEQDHTDFTDENFPIPSRYQLPLLKRIKKIGIYYITQLSISFISLMTCYNTHNGVLCFLAWVKLMVYLTQTKNKYMVGFLLQEAVPIYLKILLNIFLLVTAFVIFNSLVFQTTIKFQTWKLGYFQYIFNYFQYGIYENFIVAFKQYGQIAQIFYFLQLLYLLYIGNNILQSVLANQVMKNSYMDTVKQMIDELKTECPACGADPKAQVKQSDMFITEIPQKKTQFISKIIKNHQNQSHNHDSMMGHNNYQITVTSPQLSPFFPSKVQKQQAEKFISPKLKGGNFKKKMKEINKKIEKEQIGESKIEEINKLNQKYDGPKTLKLQISQSKLQQKKEDKFLKKIKFQIQLLFKKVQKFNQIVPLSPNRKGYRPDQKLSETKQQVLTNLLQKVERLKKTASK